NVYGDDLPLHSFPTRRSSDLADKGGVVGIYMLPYIAASPKQPMLDDYLQHLEHALKVCGEDHVGVGSDVPFFRVDDSDLEEMKKDRKSTRLNSSHLGISYAVF